MIALIVIAMLLIVLALWAIVAVGSRCDDDNQTTEEQEVNEWEA